MGRWPKHVRGAGVIARGLLVSRAGLAGVAGVEQFEHGDSAMHIERRARGDRRDGNRGKRKKQREVVRLDSPYLATLDSDLERKEGRHAQQIKELYSHGQDLGQDPQGGARRQALVELRVFPVCPESRTQTTVVSELTSSAVYRPKTAEGWVNLYDRIERMTQLGPIFVDITSVSPPAAHPAPVPLSDCEIFASFCRWGAGGSTSEATTNFVKTAHSELGLETCMHLTCTNMPVDMVDKALKVRVPFLELLLPNPLARSFSSLLSFLFLPLICVLLLSPYSTLFRFDISRKPTTLDAAIFWRCVVTRLAVSRSGSRPRAGSITRSTSSSTSASTTETTSASVSVLCLTVQKPAFSN